MVIIAVLPLETYRLQNLNADVPGRTNTTFHVSQLKIWLGRKDFEEFKFGRRIIIAIP